MSDPCDSSVSLLVAVDAEIHAGDWSWLENDVVESTCAAVAAELMPKRAFTADLALSDDATVRVLNRNWRRQDKPTNVLSFPAPERQRGADCSQMLGDIVLAEETLLAEARAASIPPPHHFRHLLVHGLLHLMGYDHEKDHDAAKMEALETRILARLGVPDPYAGAEPVTVQG